MQQATANLLADMGVQGASLQAGLERPAASTDAIAPTATIDGPATFAVSAGVARTIEGGATDYGGGRVGAVEVSTDGGQSWRPASGRERWSYTWTPTSGGNVTPLVRAVDDSGHLTGTTPGPPAGNPPGSARRRRRPAPSPGRRRAAARRRGASRSGRSACGCRAGASSAFASRARPAARSAG